MIDQGKQQTDFKRCCGCGEVKARTAFNRKASCKDGLNGRCRECVRVQKHDYRAMHPEQHRLFSRAYRAEYPDKVKALSQKWVHLNPDRVLARRHNKRAEKAGAEGRFTHHELTALRATQAGVCAYCKRTNHKLHVDHIVPLALKGTGYISNIALSCSRCNSSKGQRTPEQWVNRWYLRPDYQPTRKPMTSARKGRKQAAPMPQRGYRGPRVFSPFRRRF